MDAQESFGNWLRLHRRALDLTQKELAQDIGCSVVTVRKMEAGERRPSKQLAELLANRLELPNAQLDAFIRFAREQEPESAITEGPYERPFPWTGTGTSPGKLPAAPTKLFGREQDIAALRNKFAHSAERLVTIIGPPGVGKSRLATAAAAVIAGSFKDGVAFVPLSEIGDPLLVVDGLAKALGLKESGPRPLQEIILSFLAHKQMLLILDNFEHLLTAAPLVAALLSQCPGVKVLATSRTALHISGESRYPLQPLLLPSRQSSPALDELEDFPAIALFVSRAMMVDPAFRLTGENAPAVAEICARLDGLPLSIELAAARISLLSAAELLSRLDNRLALLSSGPRDLPDRQRTLRAALEWSYELLGRDAQKILARVAVFADGCTIAAAESVIPEPGEALDILQGLAGLQNSSLLIRVEITGSRPRLYMLETIQEFAREKLAVDEDRSALKERHADYFTALAQKAEGELRGPDQVIWLNRLEAERRNFSAVLSWLLKENRAQQALALACALARFWELHGHLNEGRKWLAAAVAQSRGRQGAGQAEGEPSLLARGLQRAGAIAQNQGDFASARKMAAESLTLYQQTADLEGQAGSYHVLGLAAQGLNEYEQATRLHQACLNLARQLGDEVGVYISLYNLAEVAFAQGDYALAESMHRQSLALKEAHGDLWSQSWSFFSLAKLAELGENWSEARRLYDESLRLRGIIGDREAIAESLTGLAALAAQSGQPERAARLFGGADRLLAETGGALSPHVLHVYDRGLALTRSLLEVEAFAKLHAEGDGWMLEQIMDYALRL